MSEIPESTGGPEASTALRESEARYRALFNEAADGIMLMATDGTILDVNPAFARMHGYDRPQELEFTKLQELDTPETARQAPERMLRASAGETLKFEAEHYRKDGSVFPLSVTCTRVDLSGKQYFLSFHRDLTERKQAESRLTMLNRCLLEFGTDANHNINRLVSFLGEHLGAACTLYNRIQDGQLCALGQWHPPPGFRALDHPEGHICFDIIQAAAPQVQVISNLPQTKYATTDPNVARYGLKTYVGKAVWLHGACVGSLCAVYQEDREPSPSDLNLLGIVASAVSAEERRREADAELRERETRFRALTEHAPDGIALINQQSVMTYASPSACRMFGVDPARIREVNPDAATHPEDLPRVHALLAGLRQNPALARTIQYRFRHLNGAWIWIESTFTNLLGLPGVDSIVINFRNIHDQKLAEDALRESEGRFRAVVEGAELAIFVATEMRFEYLNPAALKLLGAKAPEELRGQEVLSRIHPDFHHLIRTRAERIARQDPAGAPPLREIYLRLDGSFVEVEVSAFPVQYRGRSSAVVFVQDLSERLRAGRALQESEDRYRSLVEGSPDSIGIYRDGRLVYINSIGARQLGARSSDELLGRCSAEFLHPDDQSAAAERISRCLAGDVTAYPAEVRYVRPDGSVLPVEVSAAPVLFEGKPALQFMARDISERKRAEAALRESLWFRREAEKIGRIGAWKANPETDYLFWTEGVAEILGVPLDYQPGLQEAYQLIDKDSIPAIQAALMAAQKEGTPFVIEAGVTPPTRQHLRVEVRGLGRIEEGGRAYVMGTIQDVTDRKRLQAQLWQAQKLEAIAHLAGGVAHDFNNIIAAVLMQLDLLQRKSTLDPRTAEAIREVETGARRAATLTRQLLMFSRRSVMEARPLDLNEVVANLLRMLGCLLGEQVRLLFDSYTGVLPPVSADAGMLEQVLMNLVVNARDAMPRGGRITIRTGVETVMREEGRWDAPRRQGRFVTLTVSDTGGGMSRETMEHIFEPFFTTKEPGKGTGLGLASVHGIVAQHKGWVEVESELGSGSTFRVWLPALAEKLSQVAGAAPRGALPRGHEGILVVEDAAQIRRTLVETLRSLGYRVYEAENGHHAISVWQIHAPDIDLLLTDMVMPEGLTGLELAERLKRLKPALKVIVSSGYSSEIFQTGGIKQGGISYLPKPYETRTLSELVRACLDRKT